MYCTALMNFNFRLLIILIAIVSFLFISVTSGAQSDSLAKPAGKSKPGHLTGVIRDESNQPLSGATISIENVRKGTSTSVSGDYVLALIPGTYSVLISAVNFSSQKVSDVIIKSNEQTGLSVTLTRSKKDTLGGVIVTANARRASAAGLLYAQKNAPDMRDGISAEQMLRLPDLDVAKSLKRVSGLTVQNDKFVTIRGVSDRYNNVLINGSSLPSTEPNRRNFSFDIVPSALVDNIVVNKTATPDLTGEFTGGIVQINTKDVPVKNFIQLSVGSGFNTESIGKELKSFERDKKVQFGKVNAERYWFGDGRPFDQEKFIRYYIDNNTSEIRKVTSQIPFRWQVYSYQYPPVQNFQLTGGINKRFANGNALGIVAAATYLSEQLREAGEARSIQVFDFNSTKYKYNISTGGLLNAAFKTKKHKIAWKNLYNVRYSNQFDIREGTNLNYGPEERLSEVTLFSKMLQTRLESEHLLSTKNLKLDWFADYVKFVREQPDSRYLVKQTQGVGNTGYSYNFQERNLSWGGLYASVLNESRNNAGLNLTIPFTVKEDGDKQFFKTGYIFSNRKADFDGTGLRILQGPDGYGTSKTGLPYYEIVTSESINSGKLSYIPTYAKSFSTGDKYEGIQRLHAAYIMGDLKFFKQLRLTGGIRYEDNSMEVKTIFYEQVTTPPSLKIADSTKIYKERDWLPSVNLIYSINTKMNVRAAFSQTLARPDFVERSPFLYYDFAEQTEVVGESSVEITRVKNYDLRFEYYPSGGEILSASLFYKTFDKPVERFFIIGNPSNTVQYKNLNSATATGFEADVRKSLEFILPSSRILKRMMVSGNFSYLTGKISYLILKVPGTNRDTFYVAGDDRPIQGLSPYIINAGLSYQEPRWGLNLAFNRSGRKIVNGGIISSIVQYENPRNVLDFQANAKFFKEKLEVRFNISDMLNQPYIIYSNNQNKDANGGPPGQSTNNDPKGDAFNEDMDFINYKVKKGTTFLFNITYKF